MKNILIALLLLFSATSRAQQPDTLSPAEKVYGLSLFWQEANYNFAYFSNVPHLNWDSAYQAFIPRVLATQTVYDYYRELQAFCALLQDGHTNVYYPEFIRNQRASRSFGDVKIELKRIDNQPVVVNTSKAGLALVPPGTTIVAVNGQPVSSYINQHIKPYISQSASYILEDYCVEYLLDGFVGDSITLLVQPPASPAKTIGLKRAIKQGVDWIYPTATTAFSLQWLPGNIARVNLNRFDDPAVADSFRSIAPALRNASGVVIDIRRNGGGNSDFAAAILSYFTNSDSLHGSSWQTREHRAAHKAWGFYAMQETVDFSEDAERVRNYYRGTAWYNGGQMTVANTAPTLHRMPATPLAVIFGHGTASAAEDFLVMLDGLKDRAITLGERSFASTGQPLPIKLPGGGFARICAKRDTYPDGRIFVGVGIQPGIEIAPTLADFLQQKDPVLNKAVDMLRNTAQKNTRKK